jgi:hypothetical protein
MSGTPTQQRNRFSEGIALGIILNGRRAIPNSKQVLDGAVTKAFRGWTHASSFPQVRTDLSKGSDGLRVLTRADEGKQTAVFYWDSSGRELKVISRDEDWSEDNPDEIAYAVKQIGGEVQSQAWKDLAQAVLDALGC